MAAFTKRGACGHLQMVVARDATEASTIRVIACVMCNDEPVIKSPEEERFARPKLEQVELFSDESLEILASMRGIKALSLALEEPNSKTAARRTGRLEDAKENFKLIVPHGEDQINGFKLSNSHLIWRLLKTFGIAVHHKFEGIETDEFVVEANRKLLLTALSNRLDKVRILICPPNKPKTRGN